QGRIHRVVDHVGPVISIAEQAIPQVKQGIGKDFPDAGDIPRAQVQARKRNKTVPTPGAEPVPAGNYLAGTQSIDNKGLRGGSKGLLPGPDLCSTFQLLPEENVKPFRISIGHGSYTYRQLLALLQRNGTG